MLKKPKVKLGLKNLAMLPGYFEYIFEHLRQKVPLRPKLSQKFLSTSGPNPTRKARPVLQLWNSQHIFSLRNHLQTHKQIFYSNLNLTTVFRSAICV